MTNIESTEVQKEKTIDEVYEAVIALKASVDLLMKGFNIPKRVQSPPT